MAWQIEVGPLGDAVYYYLISKSFQSALMWLIFHSQLQFIIVPRIVAKILHSALTCLIVHVPLQHSVVPRVVAICGPLAIEFYVCLQELNTKFLASNSTVAVQQGKQANLYLTLLILKQIIFVSSESLQPLRKHSTRLQATEMGLISKTQDVLLQEGRSFQRSSIAPLPQAQAIVHHCSVMFDCTISGHIPLFTTPPPNQGDDGQATSKYSNYQAYARPETAPRLND